MNEVSLDPGAKEALKQLYESWQQSDASARVLAQQAAAKKMALDRYIEQVVELAGAPVEDRVAARWAPEPNNGKLVRKGIEQA